MFQKNLPINQLFGQVPAKSGMRLTIAGVVVGVCATFGLTPLMASQAG
jgi:hypothetical protein